ncbi:hypothetical protein IFM89_024055 [Coptis chinensis]|uniref:RNase H type-1 domain-containing protein n=1 Tax=Coptis chinensis TaxID=261450 RepID=A0A835LWY3_9MAGN|nr:hypothetical protein IFM89_024055 [Coptis chinensis]
MVSIRKFHNIMVYDEVKSGRSHSMVPCISKANENMHRNKVKGNMDNTTKDLTIVHNFQLQTRARSAPRMLECYWYLPPSRVDTDSAAAAKAFQTDNVLWKVHAIWDKIKLANIELRITSSWRGVNFATDHCANKGLGLNRGCKQWWNGKPPFLTQLENPELTYYRFLN